MLDLLPDGRIGHVVTADAADVVVVAPATAHWLGAMAHGLAADVVTATCLATSAPVVVAPAMDGDMYAHPATQANVADPARRLRLPDRRARDRRPRVRPGRASAGLPTSSGSSTRLVEAIGARPIRRPDAADRPPRLADADDPARDADDLAGRHVVVTAGGTAEPIDPVRFIGNRSTGTMGVAVAEAARDRGARVTLVAGMVRASIPAGIEVIHAETAAAMQAVLAMLVATPTGGAGFDALVMAAAVADFRPAAPADRKIARTDAGLTLELLPNPDLLAELARRVRGLDESGAPAGRPIHPRPFLVGFAAETGGLEPGCRRSSAAKRVDLLVANDVTEAGSGFGTPTNRVTIFAADGGVDALPLLPKRRSPTGSWTAWSAALDARDAAAQTGATPTPGRATREQHLRHPAPPDRRRHRPHARGRRADRDADRLRLPDRRHPRRGGHPDAPRRRLAGPGDAGLRDDRPA